MLWVIIGIVFFVAISIFLWLFIVGADMSRRRDYKDEHKE